jgi:CheY-like chemotaxis protein
VELQINSWISRRLLDYEQIFRVLSEQHSVTVYFRGGDLINPAPYRRDCRRNLDLARVLLVDDELASRLTLQTLLEAGGYSVDVAASASEALGKLDAQEYELVLSDLRRESADTGPKLLAYARVKPYRPATALVTAYQDSKTSGTPVELQELSIQAEDVVNLLSKVAYLIGLRATRRAGRALRAAKLHTF